MPAQKKLDRRDPARCLPLLAGYAVASAGFHAARSSRAYWRNAIGSRPSSFFTASVMGAA